MSAAVLNAPRRFSFQHRSVPVPAAGEALVRIAATAICHTDLAIYMGDHPGVSYPLVLGHESTGFVEAVGVDAGDLMPGQSVIINPVVSCGKCGSCQRGAEHLCLHGGLFGREVDGSMREFAVVPVNRLYPLPGGVAGDSATLIETLATVCHAQRRAGIIRGEPLVVLGQGASGLLHTRLAVLAGASPVIAVSRTQWKLDLAQAMGAHFTIQAELEPATGEILSLTQGDGAEIVIDSTGTPESMMAAIAMLRPGGRFVPFAVSHHCPAGFSTFPLYEKELTIIGSRALQGEDMQTAIDLVTSGSVNILPFVSAVYPLHRTAAAFEEYERRPGDVLRIVIDSTLE